MGLFRKIPMLEKTLELLEKLGAVYDGYVSLEDAITDDDIVSIIEILNNSLSQYE